MTLRSPRKLIALGAAAAGAAAVLAVGGVAVAGGADRPEEPVLRIIQTQQTPDDQFPGSNWKDCPNEHGQRGSSPSPSTSEADL